MGRVSLVAGLLVAFSLVGMPGGLLAQSGASGTEGSVTMWTNWKTPTLGGRQYWTDLVHRGGWRIQRHADTGHFRLLDPRSIRHAWGDWEQCQTVLQREIDAGHVSSNGPRVVILLHGLMRSSESMRPLAKFLESNWSCQAINVEYASGRADIGTHARDFDHLVRHLGPEVREIYVVAHSMGNIVVRRYLGDQRRSGHPDGDPRIRRMVMIGPPNQGSKMAVVLKNNWLFQWLAGTAGAELGEHWGELAPTLATPTFEFGIVAGAQREGSKIKNFVLKGPDDFTVSLKETRLPGATDTLVRPLLHSNMMKHPEVLQATCNFLKHGWFVDAASRSPIRAVVKAREEEAP